MTCLNQDFMKYKQKGSVKV